jgi:p21-activated kinase 1
LIKAADYLH